MKYNKYLSIIILYLVLSSCVGGGNEVNNTYYNLKPYIEEEQNLLSDSSFYKTVKYKGSKEVIDTAIINAGDIEMQQLFDALLDYNLNLENLTGAYKVDTIETTQGMKVNYSPYIDNLKIKSLILEFKKDRLVSIHGMKETTGFFSTYIDEIKYKSPYQFDLTNINKIILQDTQIVQISTVVK